MPISVFGTMSDARAWKPIGPAIADQHRSIAPTLRYFDKSDGPDKDERFSAAAHADDVVPDDVAFVTARGVGPMHLIGWSYGANVATVAAVGGDAAQASCRVERIDQASASADSSSSSGSS